MRIPVETILKSLLKSLFSFMTLLKSPMAAGRVYRFSPLVLGPDELGLMHATDERVSLEMLGFMCRFFTTFIKTMSL